MNVAHGSDCSDFPQPKERVSFSPFFGHYSSTGSGSYGRYGTGNSSYKSAPQSGGTDGNGAGGGTGAGGSYDPRLYESPPQKVPKTVPPPPAPKAPGGGGNGQGQQAPSP
jgi:hypothetical protein